METSHLERALRATDAPLSVHDFSSDAAREIYGFDLLLVWPDLHVVWRGNQPPEDAAAVAAVATGHLASHTRIHSAPLAESRFCPNSKTPPAGNRSGIHLEESLYYIISESMVARLTIPYLSETPVCRITLSSGLGIRDVGAGCAGPAVTGVAGVIPLPPTPPCGPRQCPEREDLTHYGCRRTLKAVARAFYLSQGHIEERTGLLRCYISRVENGHTIPAIETLEKFARALETPMYQLLY